MRLTLAATCLALLAASGPGLAAAKTGKAASDPDRLICKSRQPVASRIERIRECNRALQWDDHRFQEQNGLARQQINGASGQSANELKHADPYAGGQGPQ